MNAQASILSRRVVVAAAPNSSARRSPLPPPDPGHGAAAGPPVNVTRPSASARTSTDSFTSRNSSRTSSIQTGHAGSRAPVARYESRTPYAISGTASVHASVTSFATSSHRPSLDSVESRDGQSSSIKGQRSFRNALKRTKRQVLKIPPSDIHALKEEIKLRHKLGGIHLRDYDWLVEQITSVSMTRLGCLPNTAAPQRSAAILRSLEDMLRQNVEGNSLSSLSMPGLKLASQPLSKRPAPKHAGAKAVQQLYIFSAIV